ncbi:MAG: NAD(P)H-binding protein [Clostridium sp.]|jgi:putative NADH-flavin reductase|nr:NAD(P)H-binding protein [Clostridium sp.]
MRKIAIIGLETNEGAEILNELMAKDYVITAMAKDPFELPGSPLIIACDGQINDVDVVAGHVKELENDVLISGVHLGEEENPEKALENLVEIAKKSAVKKLIFLGSTDEEKIDLDIQELMDKKLHGLDEKVLSWIHVSRSSKKLKGTEKQGYGIDVDGFEHTSSENHEALSHKNFAKAVVELINQDEIHHQKITIY